MTASQAVSIHHLFYRYNAKIIHNNINTIEEYNRDGINREARNEDKSDRWSRVEIDEEVNKYI